jgi:hypothetical protein
MLDVHPAHHAANTWRDFFIHIATICIGLLIAVGLEQTVEFFHHREQRHQLEEDLHTEAVNNREVIARDLKMQDLEIWFEQAVHAVDIATPSQGKVHLTLPVAPCIPGSVGTATIRYFAPSEAVWTTAAQSGLVVLLPVEQSRMYARLAHNYALLAAVRDDVSRGCNSVAAMQQRFAQRAPGAASANWSLTAEQAKSLAKTASDTHVAIQALCFRLRWSDVYEQGLIEGENKADVKMMTINQERFEDNSDRFEAAPTR